MVCRPISIKATNEHCSAAKDATDEEKQRLSEKFAVHRRLVPLVAQSEDELSLNAASAPPSNLIVHEAITRYSAEALYETYPYGSKWQRTREEARRLVARCIGAEEPSTVAFTRDTTEGLGLFIRSFRFERGDNVVIVDTEHPNMVYGFLALRDAAGLEVRQVPTVAEAERAGRVDAIDADALRPYVDGRTRAIGISSMSFDSGQRHDVAGICAAFRPRGIHVLADLTQHVGFAPLDVRAMGISAGAFSLHKGLNCPTGLGALYISPAAFAELGDPTPPIVSMAAARNIREDLLVRGDEPVDFFPDARRFEHANMSLVAVTAAEAFVRFYLEVLGPADVEAHLYGLTSALARESERLGIPVVGPGQRDRRAPHICVLGVDPGEWGPYLKEISGLKVTVNRLGVRVSFGFYSSMEDVRRFVQVLERGISRGFSVRC
ncbi:PLP-dependent transferase [Hypoxylon rubiginosum]|uniref:PLP-dependent transferase n=1 Tax=Hypoxylon rubiginosum TaxID=110542 RepID=A0ACB9YQ84_9PEZI|nr:PLP-dependent transferase [Hypoxylon rubiginosum]